MRRASSVPASHAECSRDSLSHAVKDNGALESQGGASRALQVATVPDLQGKHRLSQHQLGFAPAIGAKIDHEDRQLEQEQERRLAQSTFSHSRSLQES